MRQKGFKLICGIDEAGRGTLAGPVVVGAVILKEKLYGAKDSKVLSPKRREKLFMEIQRNSISYGVGIISNEIIDQINILNATKEGVLQAINRLKYVPDFVLLDALNVKKLNVPQKGIVKGDQYVNVISAASIVAKVVRDRIMVYYHSLYPQYGFNKHKGYGTKEHIEAIKNYGPCPIHRRSFKPVSEFFQRGLFDYDNKRDRK